MKRDYKNVTMRGSLASFTIIVAAYLPVAYSTSCKMKESPNIPSSIHSLTEERNLLYIGGSGVVIPRIFIRRDDINNNLYQTNDICFHGKASDKNEIIHITIKENEFKFENVSVVPANGSGAYAVFTPKIIYVIDFDNNKYGYYER